MGRGLGKTATKQTKASSSTRAPTLKSDKSDYEQKMLEKSQSPEIEARRVAIAEGVTDENRQSEWDRRFRLDYVGDRFPKFKVGDRVVSEGGSAGEIVEIKEVLAGKYIGHSYIVKQKSGEEHSFNPYYLRLIRPK